MVIGVVRSEPPSVESTRTALQLVLRGSNGPPTAVFRSNVNAPAAELVVPMNLPFALQEPVNESVILCAAAMLVVPDTFQRPLLATYCTEVALTASGLLKLIVITGDSTDCEIPSVAL